MDDLSRKLEEILNDPESMNRVRMMAEGILGDEGDENPGGHAAPPQSDPAFSGEDIGRIMNIIGKISGGKEDGRTKLLLALKPHLSGKRRQKVDSAIKLLKLIDALPLLKESGILDFG